MRRFLLASAALALSVGLLSARPALSQSISVAGCSSASTCTVLDLTLADPNTPLIFIPSTAGGFAPPSLNTRSAGTKVVLWPNVDATDVDYALGIAGSTFWLSVPNSSDTFNFYAAATSVATLSGAGTLTTAGGIAASGGFTLSPRNIGTCAGAANVAYTAQTPVATEFYVSEVFVPANVTVTGVAVFNSATISGNVKVGLANSAGVNVATSASTAMAGTTSYQRVPFTGTYAAVGPATYYVEVFYDNATVRPNTITQASCGVQKATGQVYSTGFTSFTPSGTFVTALGPVASLY